MEMIDKVARSHRRTEPITARAVINTPGLATRPPKLLAAPKTARPTSNMPSWLIAVPTQRLCRLAELAHGPAVEPDHTDGHKDAQ
jgi:hypothetical protein